MYLKISNRGTMSRDAVRLVGFTTKFGEPVGSHVIGQWGTGTAFATVAALRLGLDVAIASSDLLGPYILRFEVDETTLGDGKTAREIMLSYWVPDGADKLRNYRIPWNISVTAFRDWDKPIGDDDSKAFKILREFICNARDEDLGFTIETVSEQTFAPEGYTRVFITRTDETDRVLDRPERYFKFLKREPRLTVPDIGFVTKKSERDKTRLFVQGVLVSCEMDSPFYQSSLLDFSLDDRRLVSEDRTVKRRGEFRKALGRLITGIRKEDIVKALLKGVISGKAGTEKDALEMVEAMEDEARTVWLKVLHEIHGWNRLCIASSNANLDEDVRQVFGFLPIVLDFGLHNFFNKVLGLPHAREIIPPSPEVKQLRFADFSDDSRERFMAAYRIFARFFPERTNLPVIFYLAADKDIRERITAFAGKGETRYQEIWISVESETEMLPFRRILNALIHESRHCVTMASDYDRVFMREAEREIFVILARLLGMSRDFDGNELPPLGDPDKLLPTIVDPPEPGGIDVDLAEFE